MESVLEGGEHLERELAREPFAGPAAASVVLHLSIVGMLLAYAWAMGLFHHNFWGTAGAGGSMQVTLTNALAAADRTGEPERAGHGDSEQSAGCAEPEGTEARG